MALFKCGMKVLVRALNLTGAIEVGATLVATPEPASATGTYQWYRDNVAISGATGYNYTLMDADRTHLIKCIFTPNGIYMGTREATTAEKIYGWVTVTNTVHINTTKNSYTYNCVANLGAKIRNPILNCNITGSWSQSGNAQTTFQLGFSTQNVSNWYGSWWWDTGTHSATRNYKQGSIGYGNPLPQVVTNNVELSSITTEPWGAAFGGGSGYSASVSSSDIWMTQYQIYRNT